MEAVRNWRGANSQIARAALVGSGARDGDALGRRL